jgi:hypothetical protein
MEQSITVELDNAKLIWQGDWTWLQFTTKPDILDSLKESGGKWSMKRQAWYFTRHLSALDVDLLLSGTTGLPTPRSRSILVENIQPKPLKRGGKVYEPKNTDGIYNAEIVKQKSIRIFGLYTNRTNGAVNFDKTFEIGDSAEYDSYNLNYVGRIVKIGEKTVTIKHYDHSRKVSQLSLYEFCWRNWDFDAERITRENSETLMYI